MTPSAPGLECAAILQGSTGEETHWAENLQKAVARPREQAVSAVVMRAFLLENEPAESDLVLEHLGTVFPVHLNRAISGMERLNTRSPFRAQAERDSGSARSRATVSPRNV